ncbi:MAG TPA: hypothetical protein VHT00_15250 [Stellaceae bacterium]|nr:hypothetical protein [Stellaceae bacterium]
MANSDRDEGLRVSQAEIKQMIAAAAVIRDCRRDLAARNTDVVGEVIGSSAICAWRHYPDGEVFDATSHAQYFFHVHAPDSGPPSERGHFHTFLRAEGMPSGAVPLMLPEMAVADVAALPPQAAPLKRGERDEVSHLIAITMDTRGEPTRLFTTNRWVTGETWYRAEDVTRMLDRFVIAEREPSAVLNRWIGAMIHIFRPQIAALLQARDETVMAWRRRRRTHVFEDPRLEITSSLDIQLDTQLALVDQARDRSDDNTFRRVPALQMAEGWEEGQAG